MYLKDTATGFLRSVESGVETCDGSAKLLGVSGRDSVVHFTTPICVTFVPRKTVLSFKDEM